MKKEYNIKDRVWIHLGEASLVEGRVVEIINLKHLKESHPADFELYIIEIKTGIDDIYEVRSFDQISSSAAGPINAYLNIDIQGATRYLKKIGIKLPKSTPTVDFTVDEDDPTIDQIHAALEKSHKDTSYPPLNLKSEKPKRRPFRKKKQE